jgi:hypothetical protein
MAEDMVKPKKRVSRSMSDWNIEYTPLPSALSILVIKKLIKSPKNNIGP